VAAGCCAAAGMVHADDAANTATCNAVPFNFNLMSHKSSRLKSK
jgi:hypothetical protein